MQAFSAQLSACAACTVSKVAGFLAAFFASKCMGSGRAATRIGELWLHSWDPYRRLNGTPSSSLSSATSLVGPVQQSPNLGSLGSSHRRPSPPSIPKHAHPQTAKKKVTAVPCLVPSTVPQPENPLSQPSSTLPSRFPPFPFPNPPSAIFLFSSLLLASLACSSAFPVFPISCTLVEAFHFVGLWVISRGTILCLALLQQPGRCWRSRPAFGSA